MSYEETLETSRIYSVAGLLTREQPLLTRRPFRAPHHSISDAGLIGGGSHPKPGEVSLAHNGVLFLDELPEFRRNALEALRQPLEEGQVTIARSAMTVTYPARFSLIVAMNPCKCGYFGDRSRPCQCSPQDVRRYRNKISGPLLDRIDLHVEVPAVKYQELGEERRGEPSAVVRKRVEAARARQRERFDTPKRLNAHMTAAEIARFCRLNSEGKRILEKACERLRLSARAYHRILKVARTIADLEGSAEIQIPHLLEAVQYRSLDRPLI
jgi:magnesium chelatase family protein